MKHQTMELKKDELVLLDQRKLPGKVEYYTAEDFREVAEAISKMVVRGAPAIGAVGAAGIYLAALEYRKMSAQEAFQQVNKAAEILKEARPTAVNLSWAVDRMMRVLQKNKNKNREALLRVLENEARNIAQEDVETNRQIGLYGHTVISDNSSVLTHCNTGALATVDFGTALGVIRESFRRNKNIHVYATETRPRLQGARLTAFELVEENIPATLIVESAVAPKLRAGEIDVVIVGADRIAANGDTANKIGTYMISELAQLHSVPFYVAAPRSTVDYSLNSGQEIEIERRSREEVVNIGGSRIAPEDITVDNPAFDITPAENITGIITEHGIISPPFKSGLDEIKDD
ncbi:S-methyl-5-thioribose-1-phosphate isomerase [Halarsenatibacter silvermanii]|uniref:Methylthioribose-1-phosphate isomerase n=1 Tax=Halarsenatibacter silvermanii TaxID=321763 RepID=A0A1G9LIY5_9FIRM|nr:S-methyl-5-thioribose-1-phosphate isomerase [Halarsenatibacter silvermanii]SDL61793.1 methylthioribose-1-phosphate isomerase [Halarsenatibacter silvermanii]